MKHLNVVCLWICMLLSASLQAQKLVVRKLSVGDTVPDLVLNNIINYKTTDARITDFKGKLLILDFWATWCSPCIASFPKLDSLQNRYADKLQILPVTSESKEHVAQFLNRLKNIKHLKLVSVTEDKILNRFFAHTVLPHYVWINGDGKVVAITDGGAINSNNIELALEGESLGAAIKKDVLLATGSPPIVPAIQVKRGSDIVIVKIPDSAVTMHTVLSGYIDGLLPLAQMYDDFICIQNRTISFLYKLALTGNGVEIINASGPEIEVNDSALYYRITSRGVKRSNLEYFDWLKENGYNYTLRVPSKLAAQKYSIMLEDLNRYFGVLYGIEGVLEKKSKKVLVLTKVISDDRLVTAGGKSKIQKDRFHLKITNYPLSTLRSELAQPLQLHPLIVDETGYTGKVDMELNCDLSNLQALNLELEKYGLQLLEGVRVMNVAVIRMKQRDGLANGSQH